ncbi:endoprotease aex-5-like isoform X2 [Mya arenaria]|uniref:endoprotease aex-5-like isoform X2 n=1 Tax=Mya arenaria TaxID=6604 RepID=UPI0022E615FC|nr:endoprotease aex-5-like isoform X2 [Mya arenaria]
MFPWGGGWSKTNQINDHLFIFEKETNALGSYQLSSKELTDLRQSNIHIEKLAQSYLLYPESPNVADEGTHSREQRSLKEDQFHIHQNFMNICRPYFDQSLAIDLSWKEHNVSGRDIVVGVTDVGINTDNVYLRENIQLDLSYNFVDNNSNTIPTILPGIIGSLHVTNHGNACAGLIARPKTNALCNPCGLGVAYKAKVADLQIAKVRKTHWMLPHIDSANYAKALAYRRDAIHIYSNSWGSNQPFTELEFYEVDVLKEGIKHGRNGLGSVYVFPAGHPGSGLVNYVGSIPVACMDVNGSVADVSQVNAATIVSVFCNGRRRIDDRMITVGHDDRRCFTEFGGESAGTAIVSGMIALLLEANPALSIRDITHILVESSSHIGIEASSEFLRNDPGKHYHPRLGFGYPSSSKMIQAGKQWNRLPPLCSKTLEFSKPSVQNKSADWYVLDFCDTSPCIEKMEEVLFQMKFVYSELHHMRLWAKSPSGTVSELASIEPRLKGSKVKEVMATFRSNHFWGEKSEGSWHVYIGCNISKESEYQYNNCQVVSACLIFYGTIKSGKSMNNCDVDTGPIFIHDKVIISSISDSPYTTEGTTSTTATSNQTNVIIGTLVGVLVGAAIVITVLIVISKIFIRHRQITRTSRNPSDESEALNGEGTACDETDFNT